VAQTLSQIRAADAYGPDESITANCYVKSAMQTDDLPTCKIFSELSG
jgi:type IV secretory pathway TraG/TraD family ATPase VirD4